MPARTIIAIGGGEIKNFETLAIDKQIVAATGKIHPRALFIPTASNDALGYWQTFQDVYGKQLGCIPEVLRLVTNPPSQAEMARLVQRADLVYVGGGNTLKMMRLWRKYGLDVLLKQAWEKGTVLSGLSAGAICWFTYGHSDSSRFFKHPRANAYMRVRGLGLVKGIFCPHYVFENREISFMQAMQKYGGTGYGVDNGAALIIRDGEIAVFRAKAAATVRVFQKHKKEVIQQDL